MGEAETARLFVYTIMRQVRESWPGVLPQLTKLGSSESALARLDEEPAQWELILAAIALDLGALKNLFPEEQARRLLERCMEYFRKTLATTPGPLLRSIIRATTKMPQGAGQGDVDGTLAIPPRCVRR
jgi:hypothetical protein